MSQESQKIAALAGVHPNAVHNTLRRFTSAVPGLKGLHLSRAPVQHSIPTRWISRLEDVLAYQSENGQLPHSRLPSAPDALLGRWLETQPRGLVAGTLNAQQIAMLDHLRTWRIGFRKAAEEERWKLRVEQLAQFYSTTGRLPSYRAADDHERMVGVWLHHRRVQTSRGMLGSRQPAAGSWKPCMPQRPAGGDATPESGSNQHPGSTVRNAYQKPGRRAGISPQMEGTQRRCGPEAYYLPSNSINAGQRRRTLQGTLAASGSGVNESSKRSGGQPRRCRRPLLRAAFRPSSLLSLDGVLTL